MRRHSLEPENKQYSLLARRPSDGRHDGHQTAAKIDTRQLTAVNDGRHLTAVKRPVWTGLHRQTDDTYDGKQRFALRASRGKNELTRTLYTFSYTGLDVWM